jgi:hypothetical protein
LALKAESWLFAGFTGEIFVEWNSIPFPMNFVSCKKKQTNQEPTKG